MTHKHKVIWIFSIVAGIIALILLLIFLFISPITKYLIEKYDEQYTGRQITMDRVYVNPFTGYFHFTNLKIYEQKSDSIFIATESLNIDVALVKLWSNTIELSELTLINPIGKIIQHNKDFNFDDLRKKFFPAKTDTVPSKFHINILNVSMVNGEIHYSENLYPINYFIKKVKIESLGKRWNNDTIAMHFAFASGTGSGDANGSITMNMKTMGYKLAVVIQKYDLKVLEPYLQDFTNYGNFSGNLDANVKSTGNFNEKLNVTNSGMVVINDFHFGKNPKDDYASFDKLTLAIREMSPKKKCYLYDSISLIHPYFKYERYDKQDNLETMFGKHGSNIKDANDDSDKFNLVIEIANYLKTLSKNFFRSDYKISHVAIYNGDVRFNDYSYSEKFAAELKPLYVRADSIDKHHRRINVSLESDVLPYGNIVIKAGINPVDSTDFDLQYNFTRLPAALFNPYLITYTSFPLDRGTIELNGAWHVLNGHIKSTNHLIVVDPRLAKRLHNKGIQWIPMWLVVAFIRESGNVIDYQVPITGTLQHPKFNFHDVLMDLITNIIIKPPTVIHRLHIKDVETEVEGSLKLKWEMKSASPGFKERWFIRKMADFLAKNPDATINIQPKVFAAKEQEYILFFEAKKKYFLATHHHTNHNLSKKDSVLVEQMSIRDSAFLVCINTHSRGAMAFSIQEKCQTYVHASVVNVRYEQLNLQRKEAFMALIKKKEVLNQIRFSAPENVIPLNGFSFYRIIYKGDFPESFMKAYRQMNQINSQNERKQYRKDRRKVNLLK
ncbi:MAG: DUF748 domain-containing protein [Paludibacter sp.]